MADVITSSSAWLRGVVHLFASQGVDEAWLFEQADVDPERLKHAHERFTAAEISRMWVLAVERSGKPDLGLDRQLARRFLNFEIAAQAMRSSPDLLAGLEGLSRYLLLIGDSAAFTLTPERGDRWMTLAHGADSPRQRIEFGMLALLLLCQRVTHKPMRPLTVDFVFPEPVDLHAHRMAFQCPLRFAQAGNRMRLARDDLALPIVNASQSIFALHERVIEDRLARLGQARTSYRASEEIIRRLHLGEPAHQAVARSLGLTETAFEKRLRAEGTSFQRLLDGVRRELAEHYLAQASYAPGRTTSLLGWDSPSHFAAACKRWFGLAPADYRQRQSQGPNARRQSQ